jgi:hypothetical protein
VGCPKLRSVAGCFEEGERGNGSAFWKEKSFSLMPMGDFCCCRGCGWVKRSCGVPWGEWLRLGFLPRRMGPKTRWSVEKRVMWTEIHCILGGCRDARLVRLWGYGRKSY